MKKEEMGMFFFFEILDEKNNYYQKRVIWELNPDYKCDRLAFSPLDQ